ncbi:mucin-17 [Saccopteryx leptura]|uniref:mucin-17 n=1 Tax=Saccopteryx leptura TaxID=249018 RepID=UPI00339BDA31
MMNLTVTVTNYNCTTDLFNWSSSEFQEFKERFIEQMNIIYGNIPEYNGINITGLRCGSVVVEHEVLLKTKFTPKYKDILENATRNIEKIIMNVTQEQVMNNQDCKALLCFNETATKVQSVSFTQYSPEKDCREKAGKDFADHFTVEYKDQKPHCISRCEPKFSNSMDCHFGKCKVERSGPRCYCLITDTDWYRGETCEYSIKKSLVYGLLGTVGAVVLVVLIILLVFVFRSKGEARRQKAKVAELYKWYDEDSGPAPGTFQNKGFDIREGPRNSIDLDSVYSNFEPSLDNIDSKRKIKIRRPQTVMTSL